ncbi:hypothetical protein KA017_02305 [Candidatus Woesebacteria bacterium]|nr:hypothetical protein [Candidatus Woesebacteria bacterium]
MNDLTAQDPQQQPTSYVDDYTPPADTNDLADVSLDDTQGSNNGVVPVVLPDDLDSDMDDVNDDMEDALEGEDTDSTGADSDEEIEAQNIFYMLDVEEGDEALKEKFLDQLQEVIWDDFLTSDVELLLTQDELVNFKVYKEKADSTEGDAQEKAKDEMVEYLEKLVPDLEDIMLEKALDLKADLFVERINGMKEYFAEKPDHLAKVAEAEQLMYEDKWKSAASVLNSIKE